MSLYKIIKAADVEENIYQIQPLKGHISLELQERMKYREHRPANGSARLVTQASVRAEEIINEARASADEIIEQARLAAEQIKQEAYQSAFELGRREGSEAGYREGIAKAAEEAADIRAQASEVLSQAEDTRRQTMEALEGEIVDLAQEIAEKLMSVQLKLEPELVMQVAKESLRLVADRLQVVLHVNPAELELVESRKDMLLEVLPARAQLQVIADPSVEPCGCRVETEQGWVDATMETRREELIRALYGKEQ